MLYLLSAILCSVLISSLFRVSERYISNNISMLAVNYLTCAVMAAWLAGPTQLFPAGPGLRTALGLGVLGGVLYLGSFVLLQWNINHNGVVLSSTFIKLGVLVPTLLSVIAFRETPQPWQLLGFVGALAAILLIHFEGDSGRAVNRGALIILLLAGGFTDSMSKLFDGFGPPALKNQYLFYVFLVALLLCVGLSLWKKQSLTWADLLFGLLVGIPNYLAARFLLLSLGSVPAVVAFPSYSAGSIVLVSCVGLFFFHEKISRRRGLAMGIILVSLVLLNL